MAVAVTILIDPEALWKYLSIASGLLNISQSQSH